MQMGFRDLTVWSFLMASAHSTGLMLLPVLRGSRAVEAADHMAGHHHVSVAASLAALLATAVHTAAYLAVTGIIAWVAYSKFGLAISSQGLAQSQSGMGCSARCDQRGHSADVAS
jgi:hypothetical protein